MNYLEELDKISRDLIILHNPYDQSSRLFVEANPGVEVLDWYNDQARDAWVGRRGGTYEVSAFPSVAYMRPEYCIPPQREHIIDDEGAGKEVVIPAVTVTAGVEIYRQPKNLNDVSARQSKHFALAAVTLAEKALAAGQAKSSLYLTAAKKYLAEAEQANTGGVSDIRKRLEDAIN